MTCLHYRFSWSEHQGMTSWLNYITDTSWNKHWGTRHKIHRWIHSKVTNTSTWCISVPRWQGGRNYVPKYILPEEPCTPCICFHRLTCVTYRHAVYIRCHYKISIIGFQTYSKDIPPRSYVHHQWLVASWTNHDLLCFDLFKVHISKV